MALKTKLDKVSYEALHDELKKEYIPDGDGFKLDADYEDVTGLKAKNTELLEKLKGSKEFEGLDPKEVKAKLAQLAELETKDLEAKGKYEEALANKDKTWQAKYDKDVGDLTTRLTTFIDSSAENELEATLLAQGVKETLAKGLALDLRRNHIKHVEDGGRVIWKTLDDTETVDLAKYIPSLQDSKADYFKSTLGAGSGATGSDGTGGGGKTMPHAQWKALSPKDQAAFISSGGKPVE